MDDKGPKAGKATQSELLARELDEAELFVLKLRAYVVAIRDELAAGHTGRALSMCNQALTDIDSATDVVAPSRSHEEDAALPEDFTTHGNKGSS